MSLAGEAIIRGVPYRRTRGSVLVLVLWVLMLVSFLAAEHAARNREGAGLTLASVRTVERHQAVTSVIRLFASDAWPLPQQTGRDGKWFALEVNAQVLWVRLDHENSRLNLNQTSEADIRNAIRQTFESAEMEGADGVADSILDWRDEDDLVRLEGAETAYYEELEFPYRPANGPFKTLTELLLVKDVLPPLFWGETLAQITRQQSEILEITDMRQPLRGLIDIFTLFPGEVRRLTVVIPVGTGGYYENTIFTTKRPSGWHVLQRYATFSMTAPNFANGNP